MNKPFVVKTQATGVPKETPISNVQAAADVQQYAIRPDKQVHYREILYNSAAGTGIFVIDPGKNLMVTKVFVRKQSLGAGSRAFRMVTYPKDLSHQIDLFLYFDPGASSTIFEDVCDLDFIPPLFINLDGGNNVLALECSGLGATENLFVHLFGFLVD